MRILLRVLAVLVLLVIVALVGLSLYLPQIIDRPEVRQRIEKAAHDATGRDFAYSKLDFGLIPPTVVVAGPVVSGATAGEPAFAEAERVGLRLALAPLLARAIVVDSLLVEGATVRLVRTKDGIVLPRPPEKEKQEKDKAGGGDGDEDKEAEGGGFAIAVKDLRLRDTRVVLEDRSVKPPVTWDVSSVNARAKIDALDAPIDFELEGVLASGGSFKSSGTAGLDGTLDATLSLDSLQIAPVSSYLPDAPKLAGVLTGDVGVRARDSKAERLTANLVMDGSDVSLQDVRMKGRLDVSAELDGADLTGPFEIDATRAELVYGAGVFTKPAGVPATAKGRVVTTPDGGRNVEGVDIQIHDMNARGRVELGDRVRAELDAPPFDLAGWDRLLPALAGYSLGGSVALQQLKVATAPVDVRGTVGLQKLSAKPADGPPITLNGTVQGTGPSLRTDDLVLTAAGQTLNIQGGVQNFATKPTMNVAVQGRGVDTKAVTSAYSKFDKLQGPLDLDADLAGPLGNNLLTESKGRMKFNIEPGKLEGVSLLGETMGELSSVASLALLVNKVRGGDNSRYYSDEFKRAGGTLNVDNGIARTDDLVIVYPGYTAALRGTINLENRRLDLRGDLHMGKELSAEFKKVEPEQITEADLVTLPLARVTGTVEDPKVQVSSSTVAKLTASAAGGSDVTDRIDEYLGKGSGDQVLDALGGLLGGGKKK